jgi:hypothetical protein
MAIEIAGFLVETSPWCSSINTVRRRDNKGVFCMIYFSFYIVYVNINPNIFAALVIEAWVYNSVLFFFAALRLQMIRSLYDTKFFRFTFHHFSTKSQSPSNKSCACQNF